jgi:hypothetical protein
MDDIHAELAVALARAQLASQLALQLLGKRGLMQPLHTGE